MDLQALTEQGTIPLLTLPCADLPNTKRAAAAAMTTNKDEAPLLLMQLPPKWSPKDLSEAHIVGSAESVSLVQGKCSFSLQTVETSNTWVVVPPTSNSERASKRLKTVDNNKYLRSVPARLVQRGGSGASFVELVPKHLKRSVLALALAKEEVWDPYNAQPHVGRTVRDLALELQVSEHQIRQGLQTLRAAMCLPHTEPAQYAILSEQAQHEAQQAIVAVLAECDACSEYTKGVPVEILVKQVVDEMSDQERYDNVEAVVRHCLQTLCAKHQDVSTHETVRLDLTKIAVCVARQIFARQSSPWEETLFLSRWQSELPGIHYQVSTDMLRGVAVDISSEEETYWKYLPSDKLPVDTARRFEALFAEKDAWMLEELQAYLASDDSGLSQAELLLRYTLMVSIEGSDEKVYKKK